MPFFRILLAIAACALLGAQPASGETQDAAPQAGSAAPDAAADTALIEANDPGAAVTNVARSPYYGQY